MNENEVDEIKKEALYLGTAIGVAAVLCAVSSLLSSRRPQRYFNLGFDVSKDGNLLAFSGGKDGTNDIYILNLKTYAVTQLTFSGFNYDPAFLPDASGIVFARNLEASGPAHICIVMFATNGAEQHAPTTPIQLTDGNTESDIRPAVSPDGNIIVFVRCSTLVSDKRSERPWASEDLYAIDRRTRVIRRLTEFNGDGISQAAFSPDGKTIIVGASQSVARYLYAIDMTRSSGPDNASTLTPLIPEQVADGHFASSGKGITFQSVSQGPYNYDLFTGDITGDHQGPRLINKRCLKVAAFTAGSVGSPKFKGPDDKVIFFLQGFYSGLTIWQVNADGSGAKRFAGTKLFNDPLNWHHGE